MKESYLSPFSCPVARALAGFSEKGGDIHYQRCLLEPPRELSQMVFPLIEENIAKVATYSHTKSTSDMAAAKFLLLLKHLRTVLLQDSAVLQRRYRQLELWKQPVFQTPLFRTFARDLNQAIDTTPDPSWMSLQQLAPEVEKALSVMKYTQEQIA